MCRFYKIRYLHLHFTDSQLYTLPSDIYPDLSTNGHYYSKETIKEFIDYATLRGVSIIPEIDVPGHSANFHRAYPDVFGNHNIICMSEKSLTAMEALFDELCELFECSEYIHIGGDEASVQNWTTCPDCRNSFKDKGFDVDNMTADELITVMYAEFINRMAKVVQDHGKTPIVWEGFPVEANDLITRDIVVYGWENYYQTTDSLLQAGFTVVNAAWKPLYTVAPKNVSTFDDIVAWNIFTWRAVHPNSPYLNTPLIVEPTDKVIGAQMSCWGDLITTKYPTVNDGLDDEQKLLFSKLPAMAERVWNIDRTLNIGRFRRTFADVSTLFRTFFASINNTHS
jgi:hexosaminidase